jgi:cyanophycinase
MTGVANEPHKPIYLLADSQLLFWKPDGRALFIRSVLTHMPIPTSTSQRPFQAAYLGASNGDMPDFYDLFVTAMCGIGIRTCCHVHAAPSSAEAEFLSAADLILLAGGDTELGLRRLQANGIAERVVRRYHEGSVLLGVSAGALQLGRHVIVEHTTGGDALLPGLALLPHVLDAHQQHDDWRRLRRTVQTLDGSVTGLGIPAGAGLVFHPDGTLEPIRAWAHEFTVSHRELRHRLLQPVADGV